MSGDMIDVVNKESQDKPRPSMGGRRRSSFFQNVRRSFIRSGGKRGADVETLRGTTGANFEGSGSIVRGSGGCSCFGGSSRTKCFFLVKGPFCFVFANENAPSPLYAIQLEGMKAEVQDSHHVQLTGSLGDVAYDIFLDNAEDVTNFARVVREQSAFANAEEVKKRLGHQSLLTKRSSLRFAESVAQTKVKEQPDAPVSTGEIMQNMPVTQF